MRKITEEEFDSILGRGKGATSPLYNYLLRMKPGEAVEILKKEWHLKYPPTTIVNRVSRKYKIEFFAKGLPDGTGWAVKRVR